MSANILAFPHATPPIQPIAHFIRIGEAHKRLRDTTKAVLMVTQRVRAVSPRKQSSLEDKEKKK